MKIIALLLLPLTAFFLHADQVRLLKEHTLFDFADPKCRTGWKSQKWGGNASNEAGFKYAGKKGMHLVFPQENPEKKENPAPNVYYQWPELQDWSGYNFLAVDIYNPSGEADRMEIDLKTDNGKDRVSHHKISVPPQRWIELKIPLSVYQKWKTSPAELDKVRRLTLIRRSPPRELNFFIRGIKLQKLEPPARPAEFEGLQAFQFGQEGQRTKANFQLITPDSPCWNAGGRTAYSEQSNPNLDLLWNSMITGREKSELSLPAANGEYLVFLLFQGRKNYHFDTKVSINGGPEYRHILSNAFPEYRFCRTTVKNGKLELKIRPGNKDFSWALSAVIVMESGRAAALMKEFVWPNYDDMVVAPWELRGFLAEKPDTAPAGLAAWDFYNRTLEKTSELKNTGNTLAFSYMPPADSTVRITVPAGFKLLRAMSYCRTINSGFERQPRFLYGAGEEFQVRGGIREYFILQPQNELRQETVKGNLELSGPENITVPFEWTGGQYATDTGGMNYFLYYYPLGFTGGPESSAAQARQEAAELKFISSMGFKSLESPMMTSVREENGKLVFNFNPMLNFLKKYHRHGFDTTMPMPVYLYQQVRRINQHIGGKYYHYSGPELEQSIAAIQDFIRQAQAAFSGHEFCPPLAYYPFDEFGHHTYVSRIHRAIKEAGGLTYSTSVGRYGNGYNVSAEDGLDIYCYPNLTGADMEKITAAAGKINAQVWRYSIESSRPLLDRYLWGLSAWQLDLKGYGAWHFDGRNFSISEPQNGSYYYAYAAYGKGEVMPTPALLGVRDAMLDYAALTALEKSGKHRQLLNELRRDAARLGANPDEPSLQHWFNHGGREKLKQLRKLATPEK